MRGYLAKDIKTLEQAIEHEGVSIRYESRSRGTKTTVRTGSEPSITGTGHIIGRIPPRQEQVR
ncbi:hypothetical protein GCM10025859_01480 [Alicyclobacillus fastidiosus]|nr:hypothetical protein GCM10025859_01480 [Alicyclobacillus fastidiosus]